MVDSHCHLDVPAFDDDRPQVLHRAWDAGVMGVVIPAIGPTAWETLLRWPTQDARLQVALGIHPQYLPELPENEDPRHLQTLDACLTHGGAIAVGECGLDGDSAPKASMERQVRVFQAHLALARKHRLPVLVHCLRAHAVLLDVLKKESPVPSGILLHSYSGGAELAREYLKFGCHFSFAGPVTYEKAKKPLEAVKAIPLENLMAETDAPDQAPTPFRGTRSEPAYLPRIVQAMAHAKGLEPHMFATHLTENSFRFFRCRFGT